MPVPRLESAYKTGNIVFFNTTPKSGMFIGRNIDSGIGLPMAGTARGE
jgi:hypothetical protein